MIRFSHLIGVLRKGDSLVVKVDRVFEDGRKDFCTEIELPSVQNDTKWDQFERAASNLGKFICMDSPDIRAHFKVEQE
jgi:hypothetical protein